MENPIPYSSIEDVHIISRWDAGQKFCIRITVPDGSLLIQVGQMLNLRVRIFGLMLSITFGWGEFWGICH